MYFQSLSLDSEKDFTLAEYLVHAVVILLVLLSGTRAGIIHSNRGSVYSVVHCHFQQHGLYFSRDERVRKGGIKKFPYDYHPQNLQSEAGKGEREGESLASIPGEANDNTKRAPTFDHLGQGPMTKECTITK